MNVSTNMLTARQQHTDRHADIARTHAQRHRCQKHGVDLEEKVGKQMYLLIDLGDRLNDSLKPITTRTLTSKNALQPQLIEIRRRGYAVTVDEIEDGFTAVATIIRGVLGDVQGALSIGGPTQRLSASRRAELGTTLCRAAQRLSPEY